MPTNRNTLTRRNVGIGELILEHSFPWSGAGEGGLSPASPVSRGCRFRLGAPHRQKGIKSEPPMNPQSPANLIAGILFVLFPAVAQDRIDRVLLEAEQAREAGVPTLLAAVAKGAVRSQMLAARALGRLENPSYR